MKCLILVILLIGATIAQIQGPSNGDGDKNDSNVNNNGGSDNSNSDGTSDSNSNNNINNINVGAFNSISNGDFNNINNGFFNGIISRFPNGGISFGSLNSNSNSNSNSNINSNINNINLNSVSGGSGQETMNNFNVGNPDLGRITRPCKNYDIDCIRRFFSKHGHCKVNNGPIPEPLYREQITSYVPRVNLTVTLRKVKIRGVSNGRIEEFFVNRDTDKVVIAIEFRGLFIQSNNTFFRIHRRSKEPIVVKDYSSVNYQSVIMTAIIPKIYDLQLEKTVVFAYVNDLDPKYMPGPRVTDSKDPTVQATYKAFLENPRANVGELLLTDAPYYPTTYIQYNICDFGLKIL